jgi:hypothetical protein
MAQGIGYSNRFDSGNRVLTMSVRMSSTVSCLFLAIPSVFLTGPAHAGAPWKYIENVKIVGNTTISNSTIRELAGIRQGQYLYDGEEGIEAAEARLAKSRLFRVDPDRNVRPTVSILRDEGWWGHCELQITVEESPRVWTHPVSIALLLIAGVSILGATWWTLRRWSGTEK